MSRPARVVSCDRLNAGARHRALATFVGIHLSGPFRRKARSIGRTTPVRRPLRCRPVRGQLGEHVKLQAPRLEFSAPALRSNCRASSAGVRAALASSIRNCEMLRACHQLLHSYASYRKLGSGQGGRPEPSVTAKPLLASALRIAEGRQDVAFTLLRTSRRCCRQAEEDHRI